jgi:hypothetical protein
LQVTAIPAANDRSCGWSSSRRRRAGAWRRAARCWHLARIAAGWACSPASRVTGRDSSQLVIWRALGTAAARGAAGGTASGSGILSARCPASRGLAALGRDQRLNPSCSGRSRSRPETSSAPSPSCSPIKACSRAALAAPSGSCALASARQRNPSARYRDYPQALRPGTWQPSRPGQMDVSRPLLPARTPWRCPGGALV